MNIVQSGADQDAYLVRRFTEILEEFSGAIALYGAGAHTRRLIKAMGDGLGQVSFILDDTAQAGDELMGLPVMHPDAVDPSGVEAVVISSDHAEESILPRAQQWARNGGNHVRVIRLYQDIEVKLFGTMSPEHGRNVQRFEGSSGLDQDFQDQYARSLLVAQTGDHPWRRRRFYNLMNLFRLAHGLEGSTAEAGCYRGQSSYLLCCEMFRENTDFDGCGHVIFDSFEGFAPPMEKDGEFSQREYEGKAFVDTSVEHVRKTLGEFPGVEIHKGWIPEVFAHAKDRKYRFVHIDVDLYEATRASLEFFFPKLVSGGILVVDDHGPWPDEMFRGCEVACREFAKQNGVTYAPLNASNALFIKR